MKNFLIKGLIYYSYLHFIILDTSRAGEKLEALLLSSSTPPAALQEVDFFLEQSSDTVCEEMDVEEGEIKVR